MRHGEPLPHECHLESTGKIVNSVLKITSLTLLRVTASEKVGVLLWEGRAVCDVPKRKLSLTKSRCFSRGIGSVKYR